RVGAPGDVHADEAGGRRERCANQEADGGAPAELVVEAEQEEGDDRAERDRHVLPPQGRRRALLNGARDLLHALAAGRATQYPVGQPDPVGDRDARANEREKHRVVTEEIHVLLLSQSRPRDAWRRGWGYHKPAVRQGNRKVGGTAAISGPRGAPSRTDAPPAAAGSSARRR